MARRPRKRPDPPKRTRLRGDGDPDLYDIVERYRRTLFDAEVALWYVEERVEPALDEAVAALALIARLGETQPAASDIARAGLARVKHLLD